jgi:hypothetical protein
MNIHKFRYSIGEIINNLLIVDMYHKNGYRYYVYECQKDHYTGEIRESHLISGHGCPVCKNKKVLIGVNDMWTSNPSLASLLKDSSDGYKYTECSSKSVDWICPRCNKEIKNIKISTVKKKGLSCEFCSDGISYPNKFMSNLLDEINVDYIREFSPSWAEKRSYDFCIPSKNMIIEMDGAFHYTDNTLNGISYEESHQIDEYKDKVAIQHGYNVIRINCCYDSLENRFNNIKNNIIESLHHIFYLSNINFEMIDANSNNSLYIKSIELFNSGVDVDDISNSLHIHKETVRRYLSYASKYNLCKFNSDTRCKPIMCINTNHCFKTISLCEKLSEEIFGFKLSNKNMSRQIKMNKPYKGLLFRYISWEEFNKVKQESPALVFRDYFIL